MKGCQTESDLLVSVCMITYNHEKYIRSAIEGVIMQRANFSIELVIGEDCSTDNTRIICEEYASKHNQIKILSSDKNLGITQNFIRTLLACKNKYIAICEGDDYWTDPFKLQKQVDFLDANKEYVAVGHQTEIIYENEPGRKELFYRGTKKTLTKKDIIHSINIHTNSILFRREALAKYNLTNETLLFEHTLWILLSQYGKFGIMPDIMSVYRKHDYGAAGTSIPEKAYPGQIDWIKGVREILGWRFFWGYHFLSSRVHVYYAVNHPEIFRGGLLKRILYFIKYATLTLLLYPRNMKTVMLLIQELSGSKKSK